MLLNDIPVELNDHHNVVVSLVSFHRVVSQLRRTSVAANPNSSGIARHSCSGTTSNNMRHMLSCSCTLIMLHHVHSLSTELVRSLKLTTVQATRRCFGLHDDYEVVVRTFLTAKTATVTFELCVCKMMVGLTGLTSQVVGAEVV